MSGPWVGGPGAGCPERRGRPAGRPVGIQPLSWLRMFETDEPWAGDEAGLERREDSPPRANRPNGVERPGKTPRPQRRYRELPDVGRTRKGRDGPRRGCGVCLNGQVHACGARRRQCGRAGATLARPWQSIRRPGGGSRRRRNPERLSRGSSRTSASAERPVAPPVRDQKRH